MYLQITTRCNMKCKHCCFDCTAAGADMSAEVLRAALDNGDGYYTVGGGEPSLHPAFYQFVLEVVAAAEAQGVHIVTNGKNKKEALLLARLAKSGVLSACVSRDKYHSKIDPAVFGAFTRRPRQGYGTMADNDFRGINEGGKVLARGRGRNIPGAVDECACDEVLVDPAGDVWACGCKAEKWGNVLTGWIVPEDYESGTCSLKKQNESEA